MIAARNTDCWLTYGLRRHRGQTATPRGGARGGSESTTARADRRLALAERATAGALSWWRPLFRGILASLAREVEALGLVAAGLTDAQMAGRLFVSPHTIHVHLRSIYGKLGVSSRSAAMRYALEHHLA